MFCSKCGTENPSDAKFCAGCGHSIGSPQSQQHVPQKAVADAQRASGMSFGESISTCFSKYADFTGRASRSEYWWFYLFSLLISWGANIVATLTMPSAGAKLGFIMLINLAFILPSFAAGVRRLHDTGRSGWNLLWMITIIGIIPVIIWLASKGNEQGNEYGM